MYKSNKQKYNHEARSGDNSWEPGRSRSGCGSSGYTGSWTRSSETGDRCGSKSGIWSKKMTAIRGEFPEPFLRPIGSIFR